MFLAVPLVALLALVQSPVSTGPFHPDEVLEPPGGPEVAIFRSVGPDAVTLRLSVPLDETPGESGAGLFIRAEAVARMEPLAARIGARAEVHRTPQALVYQVSGAMADLDFLGWILRSALEPPSGERFNETRREIEVEYDRRMETPQGTLATRLREKLAPGLTSVFGTLGAMNRLDPARLRATWERSHTRDQARLVIAGRVSPGVALTLAEDLRLPDTSGASAPPASEPTGSPRAEPELNRHWLALGYRLRPEEETAAIVTARWVAERAQVSAEDLELGVEIWDLGGSRALIVTGAAFPRSAGLMRDRVEQAFSSAASAVTAVDVSRISDALVTEVTMGARTPWGLAELAGQAWDAGHGPDGLEAFVAELRALELADVTGLLGTLAAAAPVREELRP